ncbi:UNVERIFIED_CONTAM: hypothetical protein K2H54_053409 [Gekko kuhli]
MVGLRLKVTSEQSAETPDRLGNLTIQKTSEGAQNLDNVQESTDGLHKPPARPGHGDVQSKLALCDSLAPLLCTQKLLSIAQEIVGRDAGGQIQEENFALKSSDDRMLPHHTAGIPRDLGALVSPQWKNLSAAAIVLIPLGASVVRSSKPFYSGAKLCGLGLCWNYSRSPDIILELPLLPGNCWAMDGAQGYVIIRLSETISPTAVTLDHVPKTASPSGTIASAPRHFAIYGLKDALEHEEEAALLGSFVYKSDGFPVQMFQLKVGN